MAKELRLHAVGNIGIDVVYKLSDQMAQELMVFGTREDRSGLTEEDMLNAIVDYEADRGPGGTLTRVLTVAACFGEPMVGYGSSSVLNGDLDELKGKLAKAGVDLSMIEPLEVLGDIVFHLVYTENHELIRLFVENSPSQGLGASVFSEQMKRRLSEEGGMISYIALMPVEHQALCIERAQRRGSAIALATHANLIESVQNREKFRQDCLTYADWVALSADEAAMLSGVRNVQEVDNLRDAGEEISNRMMKRNSLLLVTRGERGAMLFQNGEVVVDMRDPGIKGEIIDVTGAGDVFFATLIVSLKKRGWDGCNVADLQDAVIDAQLMTEFALTSGYNFRDVVPAQEIIDNQERRLELRRCFRNVGAEGCGDEENVVERRLVSR